ncbi:hypothetical protein [Chitinasiproducens palmae]|uniref:Uncharacterized protein n=1 Tax=Chitinasiproducens palmae TaxID=1770053 RepID=A0A1H2PJ97_9BURK|nr:hypothetical protein [Chitinasiproducens palmae]SDV46382.1 hypothetical protein SAMN05216551_101297 [Chitinasiproducens palmae]
MTRFQSMLLASALTIGATGAAFAQTTPTTDAPATPPEQRVTAQTTDPLVQHRNDNSAANAEYKQNRKAAKSDYKQRVKAAKADRKQLKKDSAAEERAAVKAQAQGGTNGGNIATNAPGGADSGPAQLQQVPTTTQKQ